jgi:hypothetical protein
VFVKYYDSLQALLKEFNSQDVYRQLKWSFRRLRDDDTAGVMLLQYPLSTYRINLVIQVHQINTETELAEEGETLPAYGTGMTDVVLDMGPNYQACPEDGVHPVERSTETAIFPPSYENSNVPAAETIEMMPTNPPPAYLSPEPASIPHNNNTIQPR